MISMLILSAGAMAARHGTTAHESGGPITKAFRADLIEPGKTKVSQLRELVGAPYRRVPASAHHDFYFYDLGVGASMDATVSVRNGVVEYVSYLCDETLSDVRARFAGEPSISRTIDSRTSGYKGRLSQLLFEGKGRGYIYEPRSSKIRACVAWVPGRKFEELGR